VEQIRLAHHGQVNKLLGRHVLRPLSRMGTLLAQSHHRDSLADCFTLSGKRAKKACWRLEY
jgi:hypothetical protein